MAIHKRCGSILGGIHLEVSGRSDWSERSLAKKDQGLFGAAFVARKDELVCYSLFERVGVRELGS